MGQRPDELSGEDRPFIREADQAAFESDRPTGADDDTESTAELRADIEQTRSDMSETIDAIQDRLNPQHIKEQVKEQVREQFYEAKETVREATIGKAEELMRNAGDTINDARYGLMETIRQNPLPAAMVGIGLGWLFMNRRGGSARSHRRYEYQARRRGPEGYYGPESYYGAQSYDTIPGARYTYGAAQYDEPGMLERGQHAVGHTVHRAQETAGRAMNRAQETVGNVASSVGETVGNVASSVGETVGSVASSAQETMGDVASGAQDAAGYLASSAQYQAQRIEDRFQETLYDNPLAVGAIALALGAATGFTLPQTERENQLMGEARDNLVDRAQSMAQETMEKVQHVAGDVIDEAQTTAKESARDQGLTGERAQERGA